MATEKSEKANLGLLEQDDEFKEFPVEDWTDQEEDKTDENVWDHDWDDDNVDDEFSQQLKAALEANKSQENPAQQ